MGKFTLKIIEDFQRELDHMVELVGPEQNKLSVAIIDTGAVIDIVRSTKSYELASRGKKDTNLSCYNGYNFLNYMDRSFSLIVLPSVLGEVRRHIDTKINSHTKEIDDDSYSFIEKLAQKSFDFIRRTSFTPRPITETITDDDIRYDIWNLSLRACENCEKKHEEGYSEVDKDILAYAAYLSRSYVREPNRQQIHQVFVISPD